MLSILAAVENDSPFMRNNFEACVSYLIPMDPLEKKKSRVDPKKSIGGIVSAVSFDTRLKRKKGVRVEMFLAQEQKIPSDSSTPEE